MRRRALVSTAVHVVRCRCGCILEIERDEHGRFPPRIGTWWISGRDLASDRYELRPLSLPGILWGLLVFSWREACWILTRTLYRSGFLDPPSGECASIRRHSTVHFRKTLAKRRAFSESE